ncbi:uncharacterized protein LOC143853959 [Tasmannia lanceolata]|uniref:uncharacterized protein LOC143853959 n=1 Tax=Tasmannia lanceolata TaxID=3420 RepID=UPI004063F8B6
MCQKIDLAKAFDNINRNALLSFMAKQGFNQTWINWIRACISAPSFSVLINGIPKGKFFSSNGIRQGKFTNITGLEANKDKCEIFFSNSSSQIRNSILDRFGFKEGSLPIRYHGLPLFSSRLSNLDCQPLVAKVRKKIQSWSTKTLSMAGTVELVKSTLLAYQVFWSSSFNIPASTLDLIAQCLRNYGQWKPIFLKDSLREERKFLNNGIFSNSGRNDAIWKPNADSNFTLRSAWDIIRHQSSVFSWTKSIWFKENIPRHSIVAWKAIQGRLLTSDITFLASIGHDKSCPLCLHVVESSDHLFFRCGYSACVWHSILWRAGWRRRPLRSLVLEEEWL